MRYLSIYGFKNNNETFIINNLKEKDIIVIQVDRFLNKVLVLVNGASKVSENLSQYVIDRKFKIDIRLEFDDSVSIKADIKRSDFLIEKKCC